MQLTKREKDLLTLATYRRKQAARFLGIKDTTAASIYNNLFNKLGVYTKAEAIVKALKLNLITIEDFKL